MIPCKEELEEYIKNEVPQSKIKDIYGVSQSTVSLWVKKYGLKSTIKTGGAKNVKDLVGRIFGDLRVVEYLYTDEHGKKYLCECKCGNKKEYRGSTLTSGTVTGCGCNVGKNNIGKKHDNLAKAHIGERFNKLKIIDCIQNTDSNNSREYLMICKCDCGNTTKQRYSDLKKGKVVSCGCYRNEQASKIGATAGMNNYKNRYQWYFIKNNNKIKCRSGFEVIYANWLIQNGIKFEYEPKCFVLDKGKRYIPDFYLIDSDEWIEIKGSFKQGESKQKEKIEMFKNKYNHSVLFWNDIVDICGLKYKSYSTYLRKADKLNIKREDYLANLRFAKKSSSGSINI